MIKLAGLKHSSLRLEPLALALAAIVSLSACGGGGGAEPMSAVRTPSFEGIAVGEPNPSAQVDRNVFIKMAQGAACGDKLNRLYIIDNAQVFWDVAGNCADASYSYALFGATPELKRCSAGDSIAGPRTSCADERYRDTFDTIVKNRDKADLGLGSSHKIEVVDLTPQVQLGDTVPFEQLLVNQFSGNSEVKNVVVRDAKEWSVLWRQINANITEVPAEPFVDFNKKMVLAVFAGSGGGCSGVGVMRTSVLDSVLHVEYAMSPPPGPDVACIAVMTSPVAVVVVDKFDGKISFDELKPTAVKFKRIETRMNAMDTTAPFTAVVKDELKLRKLWSQHVDAATPMPSIDFSTQMVLFAWGGGPHSGGCNSTAITYVSSADGKLYAGVQSASNLATCTKDIIATGDVVVLGRSDDPVVFANSVMQL